jgi:hypothetical protein
MTCMFLISSFCTAGKHATSGQVQTILHVTRPGVHSSCQPHKQIAIPLSEVDNVIDWRFMTSAEAEYAADAPSLLMLARQTSPWIRNPSPCIIQIYRNPNRRLHNFTKCRDERLRQPKGEDQLGARH